MQTTMKICQRKLFVRPIFASRRIEMFPIDSCHHNYFVSGFDFIVIGLETLVKNRHGRFGYAASIDLGVFVARHQ